MPNTKKPPVASATNSKNHVIEVPDGEIKGISEQGCRLLDQWITTDRATKFLNLLFGDCEGPVNICTLRNRSGAGPSETFSDTDTAALKKFITKCDRKGWGTYFCVSTMLSTKHLHCKESINEIPVLHIDIDLKDITDTKDDVIRKLKMLRLPPTLLVDSGNGIHSYWKLREALGPDDIERVEA